MTTLLHRTASRRSQRLADGHGTKPPGGDPLAYAFTGPSSGVVGVESTVFTVTPSADATGIVVTPATTGSGTFTPTTVTFAGVGAKTFTYTPSTTAGTPHLISVTNSGGLTNPDPISYAVTTGGQTDARITALLNGLLAYGDVQLWRCTTIPASSSVAIDTATSTLFARLGISSPGVGAPTSSTTAPLSAQASTSFASSATVGAPNFARTIDLLGETVLDSTIGVSGSGADIITTLPWAEDAFLTPTLVATAPASPTAPIKITGTITVT